jgi:hypothetical protein
MYRVIIPALVALVVSVSAALPAYAATSTATTTDKQQATSSTESTTEINIGGSSADSDSENNNTEPTSSGATNASETNASQEQRTAADEQSAQEPAELNTSSENISDTVAVTPAVIDEEGKARDIIKKSVTVRNRSNSLISLYPSVNNIDMVNGKEEFQQSTEADKTRSLANWIEISRGVIELEPGEEKEIPFVIRINMRAEPGNYHARISFAEGSSRAEAKQYGNPASALVNVKVQSDIDVDVQLAKFFTDNFYLSGDDVLFSLSLENIGNRDVTPKGNIHIYNRNGEEVATIPANDAKKSLSPEQRGQLASVWNASGGFGRYKAFLDLEYGNSQRGQVQDTVYFWVLPWKQLLGIFIALVVGIIGSTYIFHRWMERRQLQSAGSGGASGAAAGSSDPSDDGAPKKRNAVASAVAGGASAAVGAAAGAAGKVAGKEKRSGHSEKATGGGVVGTLKRALRALIALPLAALRFVVQFLKRTVGVAGVVNEKRRERKQRKQEAKAQRRQEQGRSKREQRAKQASKQSKQRSSRKVQTADKSADATAQSATRAPAADDGRIELGTKPKQKHASTIEEPQQKQERKPAPEAPKQPKQTPDDDVIDLKRK